MNELYHWGIKDMKWGVRRYQNKDGTLTPAGRKRYIKLKKKLDKLEGPKSSGGSNRPKKLSEMSNEEIQKRLNRLDLEKKYRNAVKELNASRESKVRKAVKKAGSYAVKTVFDTAVRTYFENKKEEQKENRSAARGDNSKANNKKGNADNPNKNSESSNPKKDKNREERVKAAINKKVSEIDNEKKKKKTSDFITVHSTNLYQTYNRSYMNPIL